MLEPDFEAEIAFLSKDEGGRQNLPLQGYRPDFRYQNQDEKSAWMIWPLFLDEKGLEIAKGVQVKSCQKANMYILNDELRKTVHGKKISGGTAFYLVEGRKIVAEGIVTKLLGLLKHGGDIVN